MGRLLEVGEQGGNLGMLAELIELDGFSMKEIGCLFGVFAAAIAQGKLFDDAAGPGGFLAVYANKGFAKDSLTDCFQSSVAIAQQELRAAVGAKLQPFRVGRLLLARIRTVWVEAITHGAR